MCSCVTRRKITLIMSSLVFRVAVRDSILAAWASLRPSISDSNDCSFAREICVPRKRKTDDDAISFLMSKKRKKILFHDYGSSKALYIN